MIFNVGLGVGASQKKNRLFPGVHRDNLPKRPSLRVALLAGLGGFLGITALDLFTRANATPWIVGSFGASCMVLFGMPETPFAQPRNVIVGHLIGSAVGLAFLLLLGDFWWGLPAAVWCAISVMLLTRTVHPPAVSNPVIVFLAHPSAGLLMLQTLAGAIILVVLAYSYNNYIRRIHYPRYW